jgi:hypothetical protein
VFVEGEQIVRTGIRGVVVAAGFAAFAVLGGAAAPAAASTYQITFGASDFSFTPAPTPFVLGQADVSFDPASDAGTLATGPAKLDFLNLNVSNLGYFYNGIEDVLIIGGVVHPGDIPNGISPGAGDDDFMLFVDSFSTAPTYGGLTYFTMSDPSHMFISQTGSVHVGVSATPIPPALLLFASALGGLGIVGWQRRKASAIGCPSQSA